MNSTWFEANTLVGFFTPIVTAAVKSDSSVHTAQVRWSTCMTSHGTPFGTPDDALAAFDGGVNVTASLANQVRAAVNEANCAIATGLATTIRTAETAEIDHLGTEAQWAYLTQRNYQKKAVASAREIRSG